MNLAPIILFVYNRIDHTKRTIESLKSNYFAKESFLFIFSDGPKDDADIKKVNEVRKYINSIKGFKKIIIIERKKNLGLANSVISGVSYVFNKYEKVIVLEDDLISSKYFLEYMNMMLDKYKKEKCIYSITGYNHPKKLLPIPKSYEYDIYFNYRAASWSWATWKDRWESVDWKVKDYDLFLKNKKLQREFNFSGFDKTKMLKSQIEGKIDSWAIRWDYHHFKNRALCIYPILSYIDNIGNDNSGTHCTKTNKYKNIILNENNLLDLPKDIIINKKLLRNFSKVYKKNFLKKIFLKLKKLISK